MMYYSIIKGEVNGNRKEKFLAKSKKKFRASCNFNSFMLPSSREYTV